MMINYLNSFKISLDHPEALDFFAKIPYFYIYVYR